MPKQSKKSFKPDLNYNIDMLNTCCGIGELGNIVWCLSQDNYQYEYTDNFYEKKLLTIEFKHIVKEFKKATKNALREYPAAICTVIDKSQADRNLIEAIRECGWINVMISPSKSGRGRYNIYTFMIKRPKKIKKHAV